MGEGLGGTVSACVFLGPSLEIGRARQALDAVYLPPVKYGDVYRVAEWFKPAVIGIVDGYFNQVPAVWHKEILWALEKGIAVIGAASMGALRAAELDAFGMTGSGRIYRAYKSGVLEPYTNERFEDDDEVAVIHAPAELGYRPLSAALVNLRLTLAAACKQGVIDPPGRDWLVAWAKQQFYAHRSYDTLLEQARDLLKEQQCRALAHWLARGKIDQKRQDALALLAQVKDMTGESRTGPGTSGFCHTSQWQAALAEIEHGHGFQHPALVEMRLLGGPWFELAGRVLEDPAAPHIPAPEFDQQRFHASPEYLQAAFSSLWQQHDAASSGTSCSQSTLNLKVLETLKKRGDFDALAARAKHKQAVLKHIPDAPEPEALDEIELLQLADWYFETRMGQTMPGDLEGYARDLGLEDVDEFYAMILEEYYYLENKNEDGRVPQVPQ